MGFETYQKILAEAITELRTEGVEGVDEVLGESGAEVALPENVAYVTDCQVETDEVALLPDRYVGQVSEKLQLYRRLDGITSEEVMGRFVTELEDRFGALPASAKALVDVVRLRWRAVALGIERAKVKNGLMLLWFPSDGRNLYYKSPIFSGILRYITAHADKFVLKQNNNKVYLTVRNVEGLSAGCAVLDEISRALGSEGAK
jgi:transcription-repair coupling factor (superfamily II helicase)